jgi:hypothetical protein
MYMCRLWLSHHRIANTKLHFTPTTFYPTSAEAFAAPRGNSTTNFVSFYYLWDPAQFPSPELGGLILLFIISFLVLPSHISWKPAQKTNGPKHCQGQKKV